MTWLILLAVFALGFAVSAWRAGKQGRSLFGASWPLPLALLLVTLGYAGFLVYGAAAGDSFAGLAAVTVALVGGVLTLLAFAGGLFGAWFRRAGR